MATPRRTLFIVLGSILAVVLIAVLCIPLFLNADNFRTRIESTLSTSLGRKVTLGKLDLSVWSGSLVAQNATVADDPAFSNQPFLQAASVKIKIKLLPLILRKQLDITGFTIDSPRIILLRAANGTWNYSTIGSAAQKTPSAKKEAGIPGITVENISINNGQLTVGTEAAPGAPSTPRRTYDKLNLEAEDFALDKAFPFTVSAHLPGEGTVSLKGTAGPIHQRDASLTPFAAHLEGKHIDPLAAGFVDAAAGITGLIDAIDVQATWNGQQLHVTNLLVDTPKLTLVQSNKPAAATPPSAPNSNDMLSTLTADHLQIKNGTFTLTTPGRATPAVYQQVNAEVTNLSPTTGSPIKLSAQVPGGGSLTVDGNAGPLNQRNAAGTPLNVHAILKHIDLASSGVIAPDAGIGGIADVDAKAISDGQNLNANATAHVTDLRLAKNGTPSAKPVDVDLSVRQDMQALTGQVQKATITIGRVPINIAGTYQTSGPTTALNLQVSSQGASIDELQDFLPSVGVKLPTGSRLQGGTLTTNLNVTGSSASPIITGPIRIDNTNLAGFDLGSKLSAVTALTGAKTGSATAIKSLSTNLRVANGDVHTDNLSIVVPALGTATGAGTVAASGALNYQVILKMTGIPGGGSSGGGQAAGVGGIAGQLMGMVPSGGGGGGAAGSIGGIAGAALKNGIPVAIGGTTSNPTFAPNLSGLAKGSAASAAQGVVEGNKSAGKKSTTDSVTDALGGLLNRPK